MKRPEPKLTYIASERRIRCEFTKEICDTYPFPPAELLERAIKKLEAEKEAINIAFYYTYEERLNKMWNFIRNGFDTPDTTVAVTLASGCPELMGVQVKPPQEDNEIGRLTIKAPLKIIQKWQPFFLKLAIKKQLENLEISEPPNSAQIQRIWYRASNGTSVESIPLVRMPRQEKHKLYDIVEEGEQRDLTLIVYNTRVFYDDSLWEGLISDIKSKSQSWDYHILFEDIVQKVNSASRGPERYGLDLPLVTLAAIDYRYIDKIIPRRRQPIVTDRKKALQTSITSTPKNSSSQKQLLPNIEVIIADDNMEARLAPTYVTKIIQDGLSNLFDETFLKEQLRKKGISEKAYEDHIKSIISEVRSEKPGTQLTIAMGKKAKAGEKPFLNFVFGTSNTQNVTNIRDRQKRHYTKKGELIAKIDYQVAAVDGYNIFGTRLAPPVGETFEVDINEGIKSPDKIHFYALIDGKVVKGEKSISLEKELYHEGDVNLSSGNISFTGDVAIEGTVDTGSKVDAGGKVEISGSISSGTVIAKGDIKVEEGINNSNGGYVKSHQNIIASFIDNSKINCANLAVENALLNTSVHARSSIKVGSLIGGTTYCHDSLEANDLGQTSGKTTKIYLGYNPRWDSKIEILKKRLDKINKIAREYKTKLDFLEESLKKQKHHSTLDKEEKEKQLFLEKKKRLFLIKEVVENKLNIAKSSIIPNYKAYAKVNETLYAGVIFFNGTHELKITQDIANVAIITKNNSKMKIIPLSEADGHLPESA